MNPIKAIYCRAVQAVFRAALPVLPYREPEIFRSCAELNTVFSKKHIQRVLIVTDEGIVRSGIAGQLETALDECGVCYTVFSETRPNPTVDNVEAALRLYRRDNCQALIAIGGGSSMDCAKAVGARIARPKPRWASSRAPCASFISCPPSSPSPPPPEPAAKPLWRR